MVPGGASPRLAQRGETSSLVNEGLVNEGLENEASLSRGLGCHGSVRAQGMGMRVCGWGAWGRGLGAVRLELGL